MLPKRESPVASRVLRSLSMTDELEHRFCSVLLLRPSDSATGMNVLKFVLVFYPSWSVWTDVRTYINQSGTDDVWQRLYILGIMILLAGYSAK